MKRFTGLGLGVLTAIGGFVDMGGIITSTQAGAQYRFALIWTLVFGLIGLMVYADMAGRVAIDSSLTMFDAIRDRLGFRLALFPLISTAIVNSLTLVIEIAGMALALKLASHVSYLLWFPLVALFLVIILWKFGFEFLDNTSAILGLTMLVTVVAMVKLAPPWVEIGKAAVHPTMSTVHPLTGYLFSIVSLLGAYMTPYQFAFYSSGALEEQWSGKDLLTNKITAIVGSVFGSVIVLAMMVTAAVVLFPRHTQVKTLADAALPVQTSLGTIGFVVFLIGVFSVSMGAGLETALSGGYSICQYFGWDWGKRAKPRQAPLFTSIYIAMLVLAVIIACTGVDPIQLTVVTMAAAAVALPFSFLPLLIVANDPKYVGNQTNTTAMNLVAVLVLALLTVVAVAAIPLFILSGGGS